MGYGTRFAVPYGVMSLSDEISAEQRVNVVKRCPIFRAVSQLSPADVKDLEAALADDAVTSIAIARALNRRGIEVARNSRAVGLHRRGECACARR